MRVQVERPQPKYLGACQVWVTHSSTRIGTNHYTIFAQGEDPFCSCEGYSFNKKCRHIEWVMNNDYD